jgi:hypothetical protein
MNRMITTPTQDERIGLLFEGEAPFSTEDPGYV